MPSPLQLVAAWSFGLQGAFAVPAIIQQTEHYYDLAGSIGFLSTIAMSLYLPARGHSGGLVSGIRATATPRGLLMSAMTGFWAARLGTFLLKRIQAHPDKKDSRFDEIKKSPPKFAAAWAGQGAWVFLSGLPVYLVNSIPKHRQPRLGVLDLVGLAVWTGGMVLEITADRQKSAWRKASNEKKHEEKFISSGVWSWSRHPNYVGEVTLWAGMGLTSITALRAVASSGFYPPWILAAAAVPPIFEYFLLTKASGVPLLEEASEKKYGSDPAWKEYKAKVPVFFAWPGKHI